MNKIKLASLLLAISTSTTALAETVYVEVLNPTNSTEAIPQKLLEMAGPIEQESALRQLYAPQGRDNKTVVIDSDIAIEDLNQLSKQDFSGAKAIILTGKPDNNQKVSTHLLGYGTSADYLVIKGLQPSESIELIHFNASEQDSVNDIAKSLLTSAIK